MNNKERRWLVTKIDTFVKKLCQSDSILEGITDSSEALSISSRLTEDCEKLSSLIMNEIRVDWKQEKTCPKCNNTKSVIDFYKKSASGDGYSGYCKSCTKEAVRQHRKNVDSYALL